MQGDRLGNILAALAALKRLDIQVRHGDASGGAPPPAPPSRPPTRPPTHLPARPSAPFCTMPWLQVAQISRLYESAPAYVTDQPAFLNAAALVETRLDPLPLLQQLKGVEV